MGHHEDTQFVPFRPEQMFDLVADVEDYPNFIPWVDSLRVRDRDLSAPGQGVIVADMVVKYKMFRESFRTRVTLDRENLAIDVNYVRGPLKTLVNTWRFVPERHGTRIEFCVEFEFKNRFMQMAANQFIDTAFKRLSTAFVFEAHKRFPKNTTPTAKPAADASGAEASGADASGVGTDTGKSSA